MALTWPTAAGKPPAAVKDIRIGFAELPGSPQAYNVQSKTWEPRGDGVDPHVPLLGVAGRSARFPPRAAHPEAAWELLLWLSADPWGRQICPLSPATTLFRRSQLKSPRQWTEPPVSPAAAAQYAAPDCEDFAAERVSVGPSLAGPGRVLGGLGRGGCAPL